MERKIYTILDNIQNIKMVNEQIIVTFITDPEQIMLFNALYDENINFFESVLFPKLFKKLSDIKFDDGNIYKIYNASLLRSNSIYVDGILTLTFNNINFEMLGQKRVDRVYCIFYFKENSNKRAKVIYNCDTKELSTVNGETDNVMFELIGKNVMLEDFHNASKFINNISGIYISTPIINEWGSIVTRQLREEKIKERNHEIDMLYSNFVKEINIIDLKKIFNLSEHFTYSNESPIVDFVLNFAKFEETIKHTYLKSYYSSDYNYEVLYQKYIQELSSKAHDKLSKEMVMQDKLKSQYPDFNWNGDNNLTVFLNKGQKKIFKSGYFQKENKLNNLAELINRFEHKENILGICCELSEEQSEDISKVENFKELRNFKNQKIWLVYNLFINPNIVTNFRNKYYHSLEMQSEANKLRIYSEVIQFTLMMIKFIEIGLNHETSIKLLGNYKYNWNSRILVDVFC